MGGDVDTRTLLLYIEHGIMVKICISLKRA